MYSHFSHAVRVWSATPTQLQPISTPHPTPHHYYNTTTLEKQKNVEEVGTPKRKSGGKSVLTRYLHNVVIHKKVEMSTYAIFTGLTENIVKRRHPYHIAHPHPPHPPHTHHSHIITISTRSLSLHRRTDNYITTMYQQQQHTIVLSEIKKKIIIMWRLDGCTYLNLLLKKEGEKWKESG